MNDTRHTKLTAYTQRMDEEEEEGKKIGKKLIVAGGLISFEQTVLSSFSAFFPLFLTKSTNSLAVWLSISLSLALPLSTRH